ncbi:hypothetical protein SMACR_06085 [Sordaria macrospora]|uniref:WGS project CABT00000000 data, contig 2.32 n=2 Tax=Sordaria macrospora TaxID=5147 RepID=F7W605_SORMK|nr:uncharacterized protein SMAC_06085 [Sordaria macrospora k-hell]KAA8631419.1 hypothetical protein SMACR_06085 [Sordaria macrospora]KAH7628173.1 hypothetical protein B0T09DRAFT_176350 [Sordaria sp. MPI-SDFR-AT-0083]WPJ65628.1 hypothetical protein SMAC4_06085 [Sordaria macrospora]CCC12943.1 unnamed protein product [Sordaria macrospora k-hell]
MDNDKQTRLHQEICRVVESIQDEDLFILARIALCWLCVSARPLQSRELWLALLISQTQSTRGSDQVDVLVNNGVPLQVETAVASLTGLLGGLVSFHPDPRRPDQTKTYVALSDPDLATVMFELRSSDLPAPVQRLGFNFQQANMIVTGECAVICSRSVLRLGHVHDQSTDQNAPTSSLVLYAWKHWNRHWSLARWNLADADEGAIAEMMMVGVITDTLVFLLVLNDFLTGPISVPAPATEERVRCTALIKQAQEALERPIYLLSILATGSSSTWCTRLHQAQQGFERRPEGYVPMKLGTPPRKLTKVQTVWIDHVPKKMRQFYDDTNGFTAALIYIFADVARDLRSLAMIISQKPIYEELLKEYDSWLPLDILINVANFMEGIASYPFMSELPDGNTYNPLIIKEPSDPDYDTALLVLSRLTKESSRGSKALNASVDSQLAANAAKSHPLGISPYRLRAVVFVEKAKSLRKRSTTSQATYYTINDMRFLSQRTTSFATFPQLLQGAGGAGSTLTRFIPSRISRLLRGSSTPEPQPSSTDPANPSADTTAENTGGILTFLDKFGAGAFTGGAIERWPLIKLALLLPGGYFSLIIYFVVAILLNHIRTIFVPWLGNWMWYTPMEDLRLALGTNPAFFLEYALGFSWWWYAFSFIQKMAWDFCGGLAIATLTIYGIPDPDDPAQLHAKSGGMTTLHLLDSDSDSDSPPEDSPDSSSSAESSAEKKKAKNEAKWKSRKLDLLKIGYLVWALATLEHMFARTLNTITFLIAWYRLAFRGGDAEHLAMVNVAVKNWTKMPLHVSQVYWYSMNALWPIVLSAFALAVARQPGMLVLLGIIVGGVAAVIRYRSTVFIALEVSGLFVVMGLVVVSAVLLAVEFVEDPLGLKMGTAVARKRGIRARGVLAERAKGRTKILRREEALSLWGDLPQQQQQEHQPEEEVVVEVERSSAAAGTSTEKGGLQKTD